MAKKLKENLYEATYKDFKKELIKKYIRDNIEKTDRLFFEFIDDLIHNSDIDKDVSDPNNILLSRKCLTDFLFDIDILDEDFKKVLYSLALIDFLDSLSCF